MHAGQLVEVAAIAATRGASLIGSPGRLNSAAVEQYWTHSKCRLDRWYRALKHFTSEAAAGRASAAQWHELRPTLEEIFAGELLTRVFSAVVSLYELRRRQAELEPVVRSVFLGQLEARHRAMSLLAFGPGVGTEEAVALNRLRRRSERWTDLLLGQLHTAADATPWSFDADRTRDFAEDLAWQLRRPGGQAVWPLTLAALRAAFHAGLSDSPNFDTNARIAAAVVASLPAEQFDATGAPSSLWLERMMSAASDVEGMIDDLLLPERPKAQRDREDERSPGDFSPRRRIGP
jgi:hypothetical protein